MVAPGAPARRLLPVVGKPGRVIVPGRSGATVGMAADHHSTKRPGASDTGRGYRNPTLRRPGRRTGGRKPRPRPEQPRRAGQHGPSIGGRPPVSGVGTTCPAGGAEGFRSVPGSAGRRAPPSPAPHRGRWCARSSRRRSAPARLRRPGSNPRTCRTRGACPAHRRGRAAPLPGAAQVAGAWARWAWMRAAAPDPPPSGDAAEAPAAGSGRADAGSSCGGAEARSCRSGR